VAVIAACTSTNAPPAGIPTKERTKMSKLTIMIIGATLAAMTAALSCVVLRPGLVGQDTLRSSAVEMNVSGRSDWTFKKSVVYGLFHTDTFNIGSTKVNNDRPRGLPIGDDIARYTTANQGFHFTQYDSAGDSIGVQCFATRNAKTSQYSNLMADEISIDRYEMNLSINNGEKVFLTYIKGAPLAVPFGKDTVKMTDEYKYDTKEKMVFQGILFTKSKETVAAVSLMNEGVVWIKKDLDNECKLVIAAISTAMLVRPNLENTSSR
jgi:hypothetical protein